VSEGDTLHLVYGTDGTLELNRPSPQFTHQMKEGQSIMEQYSSTLKKLSESDISNAI